jgi:hypothetical protein
MLLPNRVSNKRPSGLPQPTRLQPAQSNNSSIDWGRKERKKDREKGRNKETKNKETKKEKERRKERKRRRRIVSSCNGCQWDMVASIKNLSNARFNKRKKNSA